MLRNASFNPCGSVYCLIRRIGIALHATLHLWNTPFLYSRVHKPVVHHKGCNPPCQDHQVHSTLDVPQGYWSTFPEGGGSLHSWNTCSCQGVRENPRLITQRFSDRPGQCLYTLQVIPLLPGLLIASWARGEYILRVQAKFFQPFFVKLHYRGGKHPKMTFVVVCVYLAQPLIYNMI